MKYVGIGARPRFMYLLILLCSTGLLRPAAADTLKSAIEAQRTVQSEGARSQQTVAKVDEQTQILLDQYRSALSALENLKDYNAQMERQVGDQKQEIARREAELGQIEQTRR
ncbi:MAG: DUF3450 family protein, partial [Desulfobacteraceae bacterium]